MDMSTMTSTETTSNITTSAMVFYCLASVEIGVRTVASYP